MADEKMKTKKRAQSALEFLMSYGWAIIIVVIVIAALSYTGVLNPEMTISNRCTLESGFYCDDVKVDSDLRIVYLKVTNSQGRGIMINDVNVTGGSFGNNRCSLRPDTVLPPGIVNPLSGSFNGNPGLRLTKDETVNLPVRCYDALTPTGFGSGKSKSQIEINWYLEYSQPSLAHAAGGEIIGQIKQSSCENNGYFIIGLDGTTSCCPSISDYVLKWKCLSCPVDKPFLAYTDTFTTGERGVEIVLNQGISPYTNASYKVKIPCQSIILNATYEVNNKRNLANDTSYFSTVLLTDVSGSMASQFNNYGFGTNRLCNNDLIFDTTTQRMALARCVQTGVVNNNINLSGMTTRLLQEFPGNRVGVVSFQSTASIKSYLSNNINTLNTLISSYIASGGTNMQDGLQKSVDVLQSNNPNSINYILLISDGAWSSGSNPVTYACGPAFPSDVVVYTLGIGPSYFFSSGHEGDCDYANDPPACWALYNIASCTGGESYSAMTPESVVSALDQIVGVLLQYPSNLKTSNTQYSGLLKGTYASPAYLNPTPNITLQVQEISNACTGTQDISISVSSASMGVVSIDNIDIEACSPVEFN